MSGRNTELRSIGGVIWLVLGRLAAVAIAGLLIWDFLWGKATTFQIRTTEASFVFWTMGMVIVVEILRFFTVLCSKDPQKARNAFMFHGVFTTKSLIDYTILYVGFLLFCKKSPETNHWLLPIHLGITAVASIIQMSGWMYGLKPGHRNHQGDRRRSEPYGAVSIPSDGGYALKASLLIVWLPTSIVLFKAIQAQYFGGVINFTLSNGSAGISAETWALLYSTFTFVLFLFIRMSVALTAEAAKQNHHELANIGFTGLIVCIQLIAVYAVMYWYASSFQPKRESVQVGVAVNALWFFFFALLYQLFRPLKTKTVELATVTDSPLVEEPPPARVNVSQLTFADIFGNDDIKRRLLKAANDITSGFQGGTPRNGILLFGSPGNGKTVFAEALAGEIGVPFLQLTIGDVKSRYIGETTERVREAFSQARRQAPCVLFVDEADSLLMNREGLLESPGSAEQDMIGTVNEFLTQIVGMRRARVIVVAATNHLESLDSAAIREGRFDFKVEITPPDEAAREGLLRHGLRTNLPHWTASDEVIRNVSQRWGGFSVKRILAVTEEMPSYLEDQGRIPCERGKLEFEDFMATLRRIQGSRGVKLENVKAMRELILPADTKEALDMLAGRLRDPLRVERLGGSLPTGVLFHGQAGTGKTTVAKAVAKEAGYGFLIETGADLARNPQKLEKIYSKAKELRPCVIFIDEADDLLRSRDVSGSTDATNKLLSLMDGANDRIKDVIWIAATNHPEQIDAALLRGGRFTEKIEFVRPESAQLVEHMQAWLTARKIGLQHDISVNGIAKAIGDESVANAEAILQYAVNRAIARMTGDLVVLDARDVEAGIRSVIGASVSVERKTSPVVEPEIIAPLLAEAALVVPEQPRRSTRRSDAGTPTLQRAAKEHSPGPQEPLKLAQVGANGLRTLTLSDHTQDMLDAAQSRRQREFQQRFNTFEVAVQARADSIERNKRAWRQAWAERDWAQWFVSTLQWVGATLQSKPVAPVMQGADQAEHVWSSGSEGEEAVASLLGEQLSPDWVLVRGYYGSKGEIDQLLVGPRGIVAIEVKHLNGEIHCDGDRWWRHRYDNYGNQVGSNEPIADKGGRAPSRQVTETSRSLESQLNRWLPEPVRISTMVVLSHPKSQLGSLKNLTVDSVQTLDGLNGDSIPASKKGLTPESVMNLVQLIQRDHRFHQRRRASAH